MSGSSLCKLVVIVSACGVLLFDGWRHGKPRGRIGDTGRSLGRAIREKWGKVDEASLRSFPASDASATGGGDR